MKVTFIIASSKRLYYTKMLILKEKQVLSFHLEEILEAFKLTNRDRHTFFSGNTFICKCPDDLVLNITYLKFWRNIQFRKNSQLRFKWLILALLSDLRSVHLSSNYCSVFQQLSTWYVERSINVRTLRML